MKLGVRERATTGAALNPFSPDPFYTEGTIAIELGDFERAGTAFEKANGRERDWYSYLELGLLNARAGRFAQALAQLREARSLDHDDPVVANAINLAVHHERIDPARFNQTLLEGQESYLFKQPLVR